MEFLQTLFIFIPKTITHFLKLKYRKDLFYTAPILTFTHKFETDSLKDGCYIEYYNDWDTAWYNIGLGNVQKNNYPERLGVENTYTKSDSLFNGETGFSGTESNWITSRVQWVWSIPVRHKSVWDDSLKIRFHFISDSIQTNKAGWIIKNFMVTYVDLVGGINELNSTHFVNIFPNPTTSTFTISKNTNEDLQFHLYNLIGQQILNKNLIESETIIERNNLATGTYLFSITNASGSIIDNGKLIFE